MILFVQCVSLAYLIQGPVDLYNKVFIAFTTPNLTLFNPLLVSYDVMLLQECCVGTWKMELKTYRWHDLAGSYTG